MISTSEAARDALAAVLAAAFAPLGLAAFDRNVETLSDMQSVAGAQAFATLRDAAIENDAELAGVERSYELLIRCDLEVAVAAAVRAVRDSVFDALLTAADDALAADRTLGDVVADAVIERIDPVDLLVEGAAGVKAALVTIRMLATSARPF